MASLFKVDIQHRSLGGRLISIESGFGNDTQGGQLVRELTSNDILLSHCLHGDYVDSEINVINRKPISLVGVLYLASNVIYGVNSKGMKRYKFLPTDVKYGELIVASSAKPEDYGHGNVYAKVTTLGSVTMPTLGSVTTPSSQLPCGVCEEILGCVGNLPTEIRARLGYYQLEVSLNSKTRRQLNDEINNLRINMNPSKSHDFSDEFIFSIDPAGCQDVDDALHFSENADGIYELGIHIADVSAWVHEGSLLDQLAQKQMTSLYLDDSVRHMLPSQLSQDLCSLLENQIRGAITLILYINQHTGHIRDYSIRHSRIRNCRQLTYDDAECQPWMPKLNALIQTIREQFNLLDTNPSQVSPMAHSVVETCMIITNHLVSKYLIGNNSDVILRCQTATTGPSAYYQKYSPEGQQGQQGQQGHMSLNLNLYCHFTSPIRRYVDIINHRLVCAQLKSSQNQIKISDDVVDAATRISRDARRLERDIKYLTLANQIPNQGRVCTGVIKHIPDFPSDATSKTNFIIIVYLPDYGLTHFMWNPHVYSQHLKVGDSLTVQLHNILKSPKFNKKLCIINPDDHVSPSQVPDYDCDDNSNDMDQFCTELNINNDL
jgi:exoribonuclease R